MRKHFVGAASIAALMALGLAACADNAETEAQTTATLEEPTDDAGDEYALDNPDTPQTDDALSGESVSGDRYAAGQTPDTAGETAGAVPNAGGVATPGAGGGEIVAISDIRVKSDAELAAATAFDQADANGDGLLDATEYLMVALSADRQADPTGASSGAVSGEGAPIGAEVPGDGATPEGEGDATMTTQIPVEPAEADAAFAAAAGADGELTKEEMRTAFLNRFDQADVDGDLELNDAELQTFAALTSGKETSDPVQQ